jgi:hypothetical protein
MPSSYVSGRVMSGQTEHSRAIIVAYVPSGHYFGLGGTSCHRVVTVTGLSPGYEHQSQRLSHLTRSRLTGLNELATMLRWRRGA